MKPVFQYAFFDLDGTLTQSEFGILNSILYALEKMNYKVSLTLGVMLTQKS